MMKAIKAMKKPMKAAMKQKPMKSMKKPMKKKATTSNKKKDVNWWGESGNYSESEGAYDA